MMGLRIDKIRGWAGGAAVVWMLACIGSSSSWSADLVWTNTSNGYWTNAANWNGTVYPGQSSSDNAFLTNAISGSYRVTLDTNPGNTVPSIVISNNVGEAWLAVTNCNYVKTATLSIFQGGRLEVDQGGTFDCTGAGGFLMEGTDPTIQLNEGGLFRTLEDTWVTRVFGLGSGNTGRVYSATSTGGTWDLRYGGLVVGEGDRGTSTTNNWLTIDNVTLNNLAVWISWDGGADNHLIVTNGATLIYNGGGGAFSVGAYDCHGTYSNSFLITGAGSCLNMLDGNWIYSPSGYAQGVTGTSFTVDNGAIVTNASTIHIGGEAGAAGRNQDFNSLIITNGGKFFMTGEVRLGNEAWCHSNTVVVAGSDSLLHLKSTGTIKVGTDNNGGAASTGNVFRIIDGGRVDYVSSVVVASNSSIELREGSLGTAGMTHISPLLSVGDGTHSFTLKALGGTLSFGRGLFVCSNATVQGSGTITGTGGGMVLTNGSTIMPGVSAPATLAISTTNLEWHGGAVYDCLVSDLYGGSGNGWSLLNVSTPISLQADGTNFIVRLNSLGATVANFDTNENYNLRLVTASANIDTSDFILDTNSFLLAQTPMSPWTFLSISNMLYVLYRGSTETHSAGGYTWDSTLSGAWSVNGNWTNNTAPTSDAGRILEFSSGASAYYATNDIADPFLLNKLLFSSTSGVAHVIAGSPLEFHGSDGGIYKDGHFGSYIVSNAVVMTDQLRFWGPAIQGTITLATNISGTGTLLKEGSWTLRLQSSNTFAGPVIVKSQDGILQADSAYGLGTNSLTVSNGTLSTPFTTFGNQATPRTATISGAGAAWTNGTSMVIGTNASIVTRLGGRFYGTFSVADLGTTPYSLTVTNGGRLTMTGDSYIGNAANNNSTLLIDTNSTWNGGSKLLYVGNGAGVTNNRLLVDGGSMSSLKALYVGIGALSSNNSTVITNGGSISGGGSDSQIGGTTANGNWMLITGTNSSFSTSSRIYVGNGAGSNNWLRIENGATASASSSTYVGGGAGSYNNSLIITNGGYLNASPYAYIGGVSGATSNSAVVAGSGSQLISSQRILIADSAGTNNSLRVQDGGYAYATLYFYAGRADNNNNNSITISDGGRVDSESGAYIAGGGNNRNNRVEVIGSGSLWNHTSELTVGSGRDTAIGNNSNNWITVADGAAITGVTTVRIGSGANDRCNYIAITNGGSLYSSGAAVIGNKASARTNWVQVTGPSSLWDLGSANLTVGITSTTNNYLTIDQTGTVSSVGTLIVTPNNLLNLYGGTLGITSAGITNGNPVVAGDGNQAFDLNIASGGTCVFTDGLVITNNSTLNCAGTVQGSNVVFGTLNPGLSGIGAMANSGALTLMSGSATRMQLGAYTTAGSGWDYISADSGIITLGGSLKVLLTGGFTPSAGQSYLIMTNTQASGVAGTFANLITGNQVYLYTNEAASAVGAMHVSQGSQYVILDGYVPMSTPKTKFVFR